jgi:hypothetical protein
MNEKSSKAEPKCRGNPELVGRFRDRYSPHVLVEITTKAATVTKRDATGMRKIVDTFGPYMSDKDLAALKTAAGAVDKLAGDLQDVKAWAKSWAPWKIEQERREEERRLMEAAALRWETDAEAIAEAQDLVAFYAGGEAGAEVDAFIQQRHPGHKEVARDTFLGGASQARRELPATLLNGDIRAIRRWAMEILRGLGRGHSAGGCWYIERADYDAWRAARGGPEGVCLLKQRQHELQRLRIERDQMREIESEAREVLGELRADGEPEEKLARAEQHWNQSVDRLNELNKRVTTLAARI